MAYLTFAGSEERQSSAFKFIGADNKTQSTGLISNNTSLISNNVSLLSSPSADDCLDTCSFYSGPSDSAIMAFGAWGEKKMAGRVYMGIIRSTFVIDENGVVERVITKVDTKNAARQILVG